MRVNVYVPDELAEAVRAQLPDLNVSAALQDALRQLLDCSHLHAVCADCAQPIALAELQALALDRFYVELIDALRRHFEIGGTLHGTARVAQHLAERHAIPAVRWTPIPLGPKRYGRRADRPDVDTSRHPSRGTPELAPGLPDVRAEQEANRKTTKRRRPAA